MHSALLLGATGLVGREVLRLLLDDPFFSRVIVLARRPTGQQHPKLHEHVFELDDMAKHAELFAVDAIFCALGTTIRLAKSKEQFRVIDHDYAINAARLGRARGARHYLLVSALGANAKSPVFYNRVKGEAEQDLIAIGYPSVTIARPSLLLGEREEFRLAERIFSRLGWLMPSPVKPIPARDVATALVAAAREPAPGVHILDSRTMRRRQ